MSSEQVIEQLKNHIGSLESRIHELENKYGKPDAGNKSSVDGMRMILIGPPGAGMCTVATFNGYDETNNISNRQGYSGPEDQGQVLRLPLGHW